MPTTADMIYYAFDQQPTKFSDAFNEIIGQKAVDRLDALKVDIAKSMYAVEGDDEEQVDVPQPETEEGEEPEQQEEEEQENSDDLDWGDDEVLEDEEIYAELADLLDSEESENGENT